MATTKGQISPDLLERNYLQKTVKYLLYALLTLLPLGVLTRVSILPSLSFYAHDVVLFPLFLISLWLAYKNRKRLPKAFLALLLFDLYLLISIVVSIDSLSAQQLFISSLYSFRIIFYSSLVLIFYFLDSNFIRKYKKMMLYSGFLFVLLGLIQFFFYPDLRNLYHLGWDEHKNRLFSTFLDPNFAGAYIVLYIIFCLGQVKNKLLKAKTNIVMIFLLFSTVALYLTYSRSAFIMFGASVFFFLLLAKKIKWLGFFVGIILLSYIVFPAKMNMEGTNLLRTASITARFEELEKARQIFSDNILFGVGFNSYRHAREQYNLVNNSIYQDHSGAGVPNIYLFILATTGIVGFTFFIYVSFLFFKRILQKVSRVPRFNFFLVVGASFSGLLVQGLFENGLFYPFIMIWFFILLGMSRL